MYGPDMPIPLEAGFDTGIKALKAVLEGRFGLNATTEIAEVTYMSSSQLVVATATPVTESMAVGLPAAAILPTAQAVPVNASTALAINEVAASDLSVIEMDPMLQLLNSPVADKSVNASPLLSSTAFRSLGALQSASAFGFSLPASEARVTSLPASEARVTVQNSFDNIDEGLPILESPAPPNHDGVQPSTPEIVKSAVKSEMEVHGRAMQKQGQTYQRSLLASFSTMGAELKDEVKASEQSIKRGLGDMHTDLKNDVGHVHNEVKNGFIEVRKGQDVHTKLIGEVQQEQAESKLWQRQADETLFNFVTDYHTAAAEAAEAEAKHKRDKIIQMRHQQDQLKADRARQEASQKEVLAKIDELRDTTVRGQNEAFEDIQTTLILGARKQADAQAAATVQTAATAATAGAAAGFAAFEEAKAAAAAEAKAKANAKPAKEEAAAAAAAATAAAEGPLSSETAGLVRGSEDHVKWLTTERPHPELSGNLKKAKKIRIVNPTSSAADTTPLRSTRSTTQNQKLNRGI